MNPRKNATNVYQADLDAKHEWDKQSYAETVASNAKRTLAELGIPNFLNALKNSNNKSLRELSEFHPLRTYEENAVEEWESRLQNPDYSEASKCFPIAK
jgi:hypothetical protein